MALVLLQIDGLLPPLKNEHSEPAAGAPRGPYRAPPPGLACVPCGRPAIGSYALIDWKYAQAFTLTMLSTWAFHVPACGRCIRKRALGQALFGLALFLAPVGFPMFWDPRVYVESIDRTLLVGASFGMIGIFFAVLGGPLYNRWFMPIALDRSDPDTGSTLLWVRDAAVADRLREAVAALRSIR
jgi:hypothetical protein